MTHTKVSQRGFSLIEVIVAVSVLVILAGVGIPLVTTQVEKARAGKIVSLAENLRTACQDYYADTGQFAREYSGSNHTDPSYHKLSVPQKKVPGWEGPYLDHPITEADNPCRGSVFVYDRLDKGGNPSKGFNLLGGKSETHVGKGNFVLLTNVPEGVAKRVDTALDHGIGGAWQKTGRVKYKKQGKRLYIYLFGGNF